MSEPLTSDDRLSRLKADAQACIADYPSVVRPAPWLTAYEIVTLIEGAEQIRDLFIKDCGHLTADRSNAMARVLDDLEAL